MLSIGWITKISPGDGNDEVPPYLDKHVRTMAELIRSSSISGPVTFPVRAAMAIKSTETLKWLLEESEPWRSTLTVWSSKGDPVSGAALAAFIEAVGRERVFVDVPKDLDRDMRDNFKRT